MTIRHFSQTVGGVNSRDERLFSEISNLKSLATPALLKPDLSNPCRRSPSLFSSSLEPCFLRPPRLPPSGRCASLHPGSAPPGPSSQSVPCNEPPAPKPPPTSHNSECPFFLFRSAQIMTGLLRWAIFPICSKLPEFQLLSRLFFSGGRFFRQATEDSALKLQPRMLGYLHSLCFNANTALVRMLRGELCQELI